VSVAGTNAIGSAGADIGQQSAAGPEDDERDELFGRRERAVMAGECGGPRFGGATHQGDPVGGRRPVPGYEPSTAAYEPAVQMLDRGRAVFAELRGRGLLTSDAPVEEMLRTWTVLISGVITQHLANAPRERFDGGTFTSLLPQLVDMFLMQYGVAGAAP
jgi:hypothetical protein